MLSSLSQDIKLRSVTVSSLNFKLEADLNGAQNRYLGLNQTETATPSYTLINAGGGAKINYGQRHHLQLQVNNLFNVAYQSNLNRLKYADYYSTSPSGRTGIYNMGRNICLKAIIEF